MMNNNVTEQVKIFDCIGCQLASNTNSIYQVNYKGSTIIYAEQLNTHRFVSLSMGKF
jgi:hypothetical protein